MIPLGNPFEKDPTLYVKCYEREPEQIQTDPIQTGRESRRERRKLNRKLNKNVSK